MAYDSQVIRIKVNDTTRFDLLVDDITGSALIAYINNTLDILVTAYQGETIADISTFTSAVLEIKSLSTGTPPLHTASAIVSDTITSFDNTTTDAAWKNRTKQHMVFSFTDTEMSISPVNYWISCYAVTSGGRTVVLFAGILQLRNSGTQSGL